MSGNSRGDEDWKWPRVLEKCPGSFGRFLGKLTIETKAKIQNEKLFWSFWKFSIGNSRGDEEGKWPRVLETCPESFVRFHGKLSTEQIFDKHFSKNIARKILLEK